MTPRQTAERDYERWGGPPTRHGSWESFRQALGSPSAEGVHTIGASDGPPIDVNIVGRPGADGLPVLVFLNGAVSHREQHVGPFFAGARIGPQLASGHVAISDPTVDMLSDVPLAWYAGSESTTSAQAVLRILEIVAEQHRRELILVGGSGGGFAALRLAALTDAPASAFVWNPQTDILRYNRTFVDLYLDRAHPSLGPTEQQPQNWLTQRREQCARADIDHDLTSTDRHDPRRIRRLVYLQNVKDWHVDAHALPYVGAHGFRGLGAGTHVLDREHVVQLAHWGDGHAPLTHGLLVDALRRFRSGGESALETGRRIAHTSWTEVAALAAAPHDLRPIGPRLARHVTAQLDPARTSVSVRLHGFAARLEAHQAAMSTALVSADREVRDEPVATARGLTVRWTQPLPDPLEAHEVRLSDGCGHELARLPLTDVGGGVESAPAPAPQPASPPKPHDGREVMIYGSCVTRDAFELPGAPAFSRYVARSPIISAFGPAPGAPPPQLDLGAITSSFQRRMVHGDLTKALADHLATAEPCWVMIDLIDERIPVACVDGGVLACSSEARTAGLRAEDHETLQVGQEGYITRWNLAADRLIRALEPHRVILNRALWASRDQDGQDLSAKFPVTRHNDALRHMHRYLETRMDCRVIDYDDSLLVADSGHRWGLSPFHYISPFYEHLVSSLNRILDDE